MGSDFVTVTRETARRFLVRRSGLVRQAGEPRRWPVPEDVVTAVRELEYVQIDPVVVVARNADLVLGARVGGYRPELLDDLLYRQRSLVEVVVLDRCIVPVEDFPLYQLHFRHIEREHRPGLMALEPIMREVLARIEADGPLSSLEFEDDHRVSGWWDLDGEVTTKPARQALEWLWHFGRVVIVRREGQRRYFDLPERVYGEVAAPRPDTPADPAAQRRVYQAKVARRYFRAMGLSNPRQWHFGWSQYKMDERLELAAKFAAEGEILPVRVEGDSDVSGPGGRRGQGGGSLYYVPAAEAADLTAAAGWEPAPEVRFLPPLDNLIWDRRRLSDLFGFDYAWEIYIKPEKRKYGPYTCPILWGSSFAGRIDARVSRSKAGEGTLVVSGLWWEGGTPLPADIFLPALKEWAALNDASAVADPNGALAL